MTGIGWKLRILWGSFALDTLRMRIGKAISLSVIIGFGVGATFFFRILFEKLLSIEDIGEPLFWKIIPITWFTLFAMLLVSNLITGIATIYRSEEIPFLFARPVSHRRVFLSRFLDNLTYSSWSLAVLGVPLIIAWGWVMNIPVFMTTILILFGLGPLILISAEVGVAILIVLVFLIRLTSARLVTILMSVLIIGSILYVVNERSKGLIVEGAIRTSVAEQYIASLSQESKSPLTPPSWLASAMRETRKGNSSRIIFLLSLLTLTSIVWLRWILVLSSWVYYPSWAAFGDFSRRKSHYQSSRSAYRFTRNWLPNPLNAMLLKDVLMFVRNPSQWGQFLILVAFLMVYLLNLIYVSSRFNFDNPHWKILVLFLNFAFTGFILATLAVRFVFPLISLEGKGFWVLRGAPVSVNLLFWEKFFLAFVIFMGLCEIIVWITNQVLNVTQAMMILTTVGTFLMGVALTGLGIGMGALFPDFKEESPMRIASTPGGVLTVVISLVYVAVMVAILGWPASGYFVYLMGQGAFPAGRALSAVVMVACVNVLILLIPLRMGRQSIQERDV